MRLPHIFATAAESVSLARFAFLRRLVPQTGPDALAPSIYGFILHYSRREQICLVVVTLLSFPSFTSLCKYRNISLTLLPAKRLLKSFSGWTLRKYHIFLCFAEPSWLLS